MSEMILGKIHGGSAELSMNVVKLLLTRLLITANSGGGKSWLIRRIAEQVCKIIPVIIIDLEGEFSTLREKFPFILIGPGGEAPADCRSAKFTMHKMLELRTSAIFDLSELEPHEKHRFVRLISEAAINSPKELWRDTLFIFDEAHIFCPENGKGQSEARSAVLGFPTRGRKRGFGCIFATQRLAKLAFDARAEMLNRMIGPMIEPDDIKAAASILGVKDDHEFRKDMRTMPEGNFFAFGRAICIEPTRFKAGSVETSHESRKARHGVKAPPTPSELKRLLPQLADLPAQAEDEAQNVEGLQRQLREARQALARQTVPTAKTETKIIKERIFTPGESKRLTKLLPAMDTLTAQIAGLAKHIEKLSIAGAGIKDEAAKLRTKITPECEVKAPAVSVIGIEKDKLKTGDTIQIGQHKFEYKPDACKNVAAAINGVKISGALLDTLKVCAQYRDTGATDSQIGILVGRKATSRKTFRSTLKAEGLIEDYGQGWRATDKGIELLGPDFQPLPTGKALQDYWRNILTGAELICFNLFCERYPNEVTAEELEQATQRKATSIKTFKSNLRARKLIEGDRASANLFIKGLIQNVTLETHCSLASEIRPLSKRR